MNDSLRVLDSEGRIKETETGGGGGNPNGQATMANSAPVVIASDQSPIPVTGTITVDTSLLATSANQATEIASLASIDAGIPTTLGQTTMANSMPVVLASNQSAIPISGTVTVDTSLLATAANQATEIASLSSIDSKLTAPLIVSATNLDIRDLVFATDKVDISGSTVTANAGSGTFNIAGAVTNTVLSVVGGGTEATAQRVTIASDSTGVLSVDDNGGSLTIDNTNLDTALSTLDTSINTLLKPANTLAAVTSITNVVHVDDNSGSLTIDGTVSLSAGSAVIGHVIADSGSTTAVTGNVTVIQGTGTNLHTVVDSGSITANAGTNLNTSLLALESGGNLAAIKADVDKIPSQGQAVMAASMPVVIASNQSAVPISGTVTVDTSLLATAAKQDTQITSLASIDAGIPAALGQTTMSASMPVTIASDQTQLVVSVGAIDNTTLYNTPLTVTGAISGILTTGYQSISIQIGGTWVGRVFVEGSNDNTDYSPVFIINLNDLIQQESIYSGGNYTFKVSTKYFRLNVTQLSGTITNTIVGKTGLGVSGIDALSSVMNEDTGVQLSVRETSIKKDSTNALIPSDTPKFFDLVQKTGASGVNQVGDIIDTTGYQSIAVYIINAGSGAVMTFQSSHDTFNWTAIQGVTSAGLAASGSSGITASTPLIMFPVMGRYFRINTNGSTLARALVYLRQVACPSTNQNIAFISGVAPTSTGITGTLAVGGAIAVGVSGNASNPVIVAGTDSTGLVRKILTDTSGRAILSVTDQSQATSGRALGGLAPNNAYNVTSLSVQDTSQFEGQSLIEIAAQLLLEQKITNQYLFELPSVLQRCFATLNDANNKIDHGFKNEPQEFRNDISMFAA